MKAFASKHILAYKAELKAAKEELAALRGPAAFAAVDAIFSALLADLAAPGVVTAAAVRRAHYAINAAIAGVAPPGVRAGPEGIARPAFYPPPHQ